ncbi:MAG: AMP-binding protein [Aurantimonas endophytica]|uniref:AMP-binding protein n=1 Tax=Aurantimonas endophytica TaxID=1522175 RepID=UPI003001B9AA
MSSAGYPFASLIELLAGCRIETGPGESLAFSEYARSAEDAVGDAFPAVVAGQGILVDSDASLVSRVIGLWKAGAVPVVVPAPLSAGAMPSVHWDWRGDMPVRLAADPPSLVSGQDCPAIIHLSSGSTGLPRPAPRSTASLLAEAGRYVSRYGLSPGERVLVAAPICHSFGFGAFLGAAAAGGVVSLPTAFHARRLARRLCAGAFDVAVLTVPMARLLIAAAGPDHASGGAKPRLAIVGAGPVSDRLAAAFEQSFGCPLGRNYGSSETGATFGAATALPEGVIGRPFDGVRIVAPSMPGETAELVLDLGHAVLANTSAGESHIWRTGDRATLLAGGSIRLHGRLDDRLKLDGRTIDGAAVVAAALAVPCVRDAVAIATVAPWAPDRDLLVVACEGSGVDREHVRVAVAATNAPAPLVLTFASLPRTAAGKPDRAAIVAAVAGDQPRADRDITPVVREPVP